MRKCLNCSMIHVQADAVEQIKLARRHGFDAVDLSIGGIEDPKRVRDAMSEAGVLPGCLNGLLPVRSTDPDTDWRTAMESMPDRLKIAQMLGFTRTMVVLMPFHDELAFDGCMDFHVRRLREACDILTEAGIRVGLEYVSAVTRRAGHRHTFIYDLSGCMRLIDSVGRENLGVVLDSFHWYCAGESVADIAALTDAQVVNVHVNDAIANRPISDQVVGERELPGTTGVINITAFMRGLSQIGYQGPVTCEPMNAALKALSVDQAVAAVNAAMDKIIAPGSEVPGSRVS